MLDRIVLFFKRACVIAVAALIAGPVLACGDQFYNEVLHLGRSASSGAAVIAALIAFAAVIGFLMPIFCKEDKKSDK